MTGLLGSPLTKVKPRLDKGQINVAKCSEDTYNLQLFCLSEQQGNVSKRRISTPVMAKRLFTSNAQLCIDQRISHFS